MKNRYVFEMVMVVIPYCFRDFSTKEHLNVAKKVQRQGVNFRACSIWNCILHLQKRGK